MSKLHPRTMIVQGARNEMHAAMIGIRTKHDISDVEYLHCLSYLAHRMMRRMLREERHPDDPDAAADLAGRSPRRLFRGS